MSFNTGDVPSVLSDEIPEELKVDVDEKPPISIADELPLSILKSVKKMGRPKKNLNSDVVPRKFEFNGFDARCATCKLALHDSKINEMYYKDRQVKDVYQYIQKKYDDCPSYRSISTHCKKHLESPEANERRDLQKYNSEINAYISKIKTMTDNQEIERIKAIVSKNIESLDNLEFGQDIELLCETRKTINSLFKTYLECKNYELKRAGIGATAEELENRVKAFCSELVENIIKSEKANKANEIINIIQKNMPANL